MRMTVKDQSVLQKRAAAGFILRLAGARSAWTICPWADCQRRAGRKAPGLGGGSQPTCKSIFWAQDAQLAGFCRHLFGYGFLAEKSIFSFQFATNL